MANEIEKRNEAFLIYQDENGIARVNVRFEGEDVWLNVEQIMELFDASQQDVSYHIKQIYADGEQVAERTRKKFLIVRQEDQIIPAFLMIISKKCLYLQHERNKGDDIRACRRTASAGGGEFFPQPTADGTVPADSAPQASDGRGTERRRRTDCGACAVHSALQALVAAALPVHPCAHLRQQRMHGAGVRGAHGGADRTAEPQGALYGGEQPQREDVWLP